jgi:hypothetical protein
LISRTLRVTPLLAGLLTVLAVPAPADAIVRSAAGPDANSINSTVTFFRNDLGADNGDAPAAATGRREASWDDVPDELASPAPLPGTFYRDTLPRGLILSTPGAGGLLVSQDDNNPADADPDMVRFGDRNPNYTTAFEAFSPQRLFSPVGSNEVDVSFVVPGTGTAATVDGFGAVFTDVDASGATTIETFDQDGTSLGVLPAPVSAGNGSVSFVGVKFTTGERIASVKIRLGSATLGETEGPGNDVVVADNFIYGEPQAKLPPPTITFGDPDRGVIESAGLLFVTITRTGDLSRLSKVSFAGVDDTARGNGVDYTRPVSTVTFGRNQANVTIPIGITGDRLVEPSETFLVRLSDPVNGVLSDRNALILRIDDDDRIPAVTVADRVKPRVLLDPARSITRARLRRSGITFRMVMSERGRGVIRLRAGKRLLGRSTFRFTSARKVTRRQRLTRAASKALAAGRIRGPLILEVNVADAAGNKGSDLVRIRLR